MALMKFREPNHVNWHGVRPAHDGRQIEWSNAQTGVGNTVVYPGHATQTLYLTHFNLTYFLSVAASTYCALQVYTAAPALLYYITAIYARLEGSDVIEAALFYPIEVLPTYTINVLSGNANMIARGTIHGWVE